jgi:hypothetical protein
MNMKLIHPSDPLYFKQSSDAPYDRHDYKLFFINGKVETHKSWESLQSKWFKSPSQFLSHVEVLDKKSKGKGF